MLKEMPVVLTEALNANRQTFLAGVEQITNITETYVEFIFDEIPYKAEYRGDAWYVQFNRRSSDHA